MTIASPALTDDPTLETLFNTGRRLAIRCNHCGRFRYMNGARFAQDKRVSALSEVLSCGSCGSKDVSAIAVSRNSENGYWPAEYS